MDNGKLEKLLEEKKNYIKTLRNGHNKKDLKRWRDEVLMILDHLIGEESKYYAKFQAINYSSMVGTRDAEKQKQYNINAIRRGLDDAESALEAILFGLDNNLIS